MDFMPSLTLDQLPYVCLTVVCSHLSAEDLARFSRVCKFKSFNLASTAEFLWRRHCLLRWAFCDIKQIKAETQKWHCYYLARRKVENHMDLGRPTKDYRVKSLRGHKSDIIMAVCLEGSSIDWEQLVPPCLITLSSDSVVYAWDISEAKPVWSIEDQSICFIAGCNETNMIATGGALGRVTIYNVCDWSVSASVALDGLVSFIRFIKFQSNTLVAICHDLPDSDGGVIKIWNPSKLNTPPLITLKSPVVCTQMVYGYEQWLAGSQNNSDIIPIWNLSLLDKSPSVKSHDPHLIVHCQSNGTLMWLQPGMLATTSVVVGQYFMPMPIPGQVHQLRRRRINQTMESSELELWHIAKQLEKKTANTVSHMFDSQTISLESGVYNVMAKANGFLLIGNSNGDLAVVEPTTGKTLQRFNDHKGSITDIYADTYRVLTCSSDFSIRVYRWKKSANSILTLESLYQLLGGSVALKKHDGFTQVLCSAGSCIGIAGESVKVYNFSHQLQ